MLSGLICGKCADEHGGDDGEILGDIVGDAESSQRTARHQQLLSDLDDLDELGGVAVEIDHVSGFLGGLRAGVHRDADVGLGKRGRVVGSVAGHCHEVSGGLLALQQRELVFGRRLGEEVIDARFLCDGGGGERIVAGDHDGLDPHCAKPLEAVRQSAFDDVLEMNDAHGLSCVATTRGVPPARLIVSTA